MTIVTNRTVSSTFRSLIKTLLPQLGENPAYWNFLGVLLFGLREWETGKTRIPREVIAVCEGNKYLIDDKNYVAEEFLMEFKEKVNPTLVWSDWSYVEHECRVVEHITWSPEIIEAVRQERDKVWKDSPRIYLMDGKPWNPRRQRETRNITYDEVMRRMELTEVEIARKLLRYMNSLPNSGFNINIEKILREFNKFRKFYTDTGLIPAYLMPKV